MSGSGRKRSSKWDLIDDPEFAQGRGSNKDDIMSKDYGVLDATMEWDVDENYGRRISPGFDERQHRRSSRSPKNGWSRPVRSSRSRSPPHGLRRDSGVNDRNRARAGGSTQPCREFAAGKCRRGDHCHFLHDNQNHEDSWESKHREDAAPRYSAPNESRDHSLKGGKSNEACYNFAKGRCRMGASCKFVHENYVAYGKPSLDELTRERETDRRPRDSSFEKGGGHGPSRSSDTPCKFFASGNCRNGKYCRFSHDRQTCRSPNRRSRDDGWAGNQGGDYQTPARPKLSGLVSPNRRLRDDRWGSDLNMADADKVWDSPKGIDTVSVSDTAKMVEEKGENVGAKEPRPAWPTRDGWGHGLDKSSVHAETPFLSDTKEGDRGHNLDPFFCDKKEADRGHSFDKSRVHGETPFLTDKKEADRDMAENTSTKMHSSQSIGTEVWSGDAEMSPDWNYRVGSSSHIEEKHGQSKHGITQGGTGRYLATSEHDGIQVASGQGFCENVHNVNPLHSSGPRAEGKSQVAVPILPSRGGIVAGMQIQEVSTEKKYNVEPNIMDADLSQVSSRNPPTQNAVSKEKLAEINNLSASLAHFLGAGQQLPQLYAALNSHDAKDTPFLAKSEVPAMRISNTFIKEDPAVGLPKQCDPMCDSIEPKNGDASGVPQAIPPRKKAAEGEVEIPSQLSNLGRQNGGATFKAACSEELVKSGHSIQLQSGQNPKVNKDNTEVEAGERQNSQDDNKNTKEIRPSKNMDQNGGPDESNKTKDMKGNRAFKFALVEFVKELLKQPWKEGRITKEDYKTIVKKVVDKVTGTMQGANIPQTQEKIDHYLSFSKPKLNKLVQAYVEKVHKP